MGFYIRKSLKAGPFRFNLSKSGIGVSAGIPGFRVGSGPRGNYIHAGRYGLYYRATLNGGHPAAAGSSSLPPKVQSGSSIAMDDVAGADAQQLAPTAGGDLVEQLNAASAKTAFALPAAIALFVIGCFFMPWGLILWALAVPFVWWLALHDRARKSVVVFYDVNDDQATWYQQLVDAATGMQSARSIWRVLQSGAVAAGYQQKVNAGATSLVNRVPVTATLAAPKSLVTNLSVPTLVAGKSSLSFLPDRVLVRDGKQFTDVSYESLTAHAEVTNFIETGTVPADAARVGQTWQYVNKSGGPDRRYSNNPQIPILQYGQVNLTSSGGLNWHLLVSLAGAAMSFVPLLASRPAIELGTVTESAVDVPPATVAYEASNSTAPQSGPGRSRAVLFGALALGLAVIASVLYIVGGSVHQAAGLIALGLFPFGLASGVLAVLAIVFGARTLAVKPPPANRSSARRGFVSGITAFSLPVIAFIVGASLSVGSLPASSDIAAPSHAAKTITLADYSGSVESTASKHLTAAGVKVKLVTWDGSPAPDSWAGWIVVGENPEPGTALGPDATVTIELRPPFTDAPTPTATPTPTPTATPTPTPAHTTAPVHVAPKPAPKPKPKPKPPVHAAPIIPGAFCPAADDHKIGYSAAGKAYECGLKGPDSHGHLHWNTL